MFSMNPLARRRALKMGAAIAVTPWVAAPISAFAAVNGKASTRKVLDHHLGAFAKGLDELMADYSKHSVILTQDKQYSGLVEIRGFFDAFLKGVKPGFWEAFKINAQSIHGEVAYLVWEAKPFVNLATDTLVVHRGKIAYQTFTAT